MKFVVSKEVFKKFPNYIVGVVVATDIKRNHHEEISKLLNVSVQKIKNKFLTENQVAQYPDISIWRDAFLNLGWNHKEIKSSIDAMINRIVKYGNLPEINDVVDLANYISLKYILPVGAHDIGRMSGDIVVRLAKQGDKFTSMGQTKTEKVPLGEIVYADTIEVRTRKWVWRQGEKAKIFPGTKTVFFPIDGFADTNYENVVKARDGLANLIENLFSGKTQVFLVNYDNPETGEFNKAMKKNIFKSKLSLDKPSSFVAEFSIKRQVKKSRTLTNQNPERREKNMKKVVTDPKVINEVIDSFARTTEEIFSLDELKNMLFSGRQLVMKYGVDVTAPDLHIGHAVNLWMYRRLQELGHKMVFLIGDFTTQIGDPTGRNKTRPIIPISEIQKNAEAFIKQAMLVLHDDPELIEIRRNSEWSNKMSAKELISLMSMITHDRLVSREMFRRRIQEGKEIYEHELVYPILQGYDSVMLKADLTIIGSDQLFNEMIGRFFQEKFGQVPQVIITTKITPGIAGKEKQSKSLGNYIGLRHSPREKLGRIMSMPDNLIIEYFKVYTEVPIEEISRIEKDLSSDPMKYKLMLAQEIVRRYHGENIAEQEVEWFKKTFSKREIPEDTEHVSIGIKSTTLFQALRKCFSMQEKSNSELKRLIKQRAVSIEGRIIENADKEIVLPVEGINLKVGKRKWFKVKP